MKVNPVSVGGFEIGGDALTIIGGPCVIEDEDVCFEVAARMKRLCSKHGMNYVFKASFEKDNRSSAKSYKGPGLERGLEILAAVKQKEGVPVLSDVHCRTQVEAAARVLDIIQIPAYLCQQTELALTVARSGRAVNVKKGQFVAPWDMKNVVEKIRSTGSRRILLTERGSSFGYNNLVVDMKSVPVMHDLGCPVVFDATHSAQLPGGLGEATGGQREFVPVMARAAVAAGADGVFFEVHEDPDRALSDGPNSMRLDDMPDLLRRLLAIAAAATAP